MPETNFRELLDFISNLKSFFFFAGNYLNNDLLMGRLVEVDINQIKI